MSLREDYPWLGEVADFWEPVQQAPYDLLMNAAAWHMLPSRERIMGGIDAARAMGDVMTGEALGGLTGLYEGARSAMGGGPFLDPAVKGIERFRDVWGAEGPRTIGGQTILGAMEAPEQAYRPQLEAGAEALFESTGSPLLATGALMVPEVLDTIIPGRTPSTVRGPTPSDAPVQTRLFPDERGRMEEPAGILTDRRPFYSKLEQEIMDAPQDTMTGKQWAGYLQKKGVKPDEMKWTGVGEELAGMGQDKVTKAELLRGLDDPSGRVDPSIIVRSDQDVLGNLLDEYSSAAGDYMQGILSDVGDPLNKAPERFPTKYEGTAMLRGPDYREYQINLPQERFGLFRRSHWPEQDNTLMHLRTTRRETLDGDPVFFIDEIQSDWHQQGRQHGYDAPDANKAYQDWDREYRKVDAERAETARQREELVANYGDDRSILDEPEFHRLRDRERELMMRQVDMRREQPRPPTIPEAPFKNAWFDMGAKLAVDEAIKRGDDYVAFPTGEYLKDAYDADLYVETMYFDPESNELIFDGGEHASIDIDEAADLGLDPRLIEQARERGFNLDQMRADEIEWRLNEDFNDRYDFEPAYYDELTQEYYESEQKAADAIREYLRDFDEDMDPLELQGEVDDAVENLTVATNVYDYGYESEHLDMHPDDAADHMKAREANYLETLDNEELLGEENIEYARENASIAVGDTIVDPNVSEISGAVSFLDNMVPGGIEKFLKKNKDWNTEMEWIEMDTGMAGKGEYYVPGFRITDEMRAAVRERGQPLFMRPEVAGAGLAAGALAAQQEQSEDKPQGRLSM